jgi:hypothetical protein
MDNPSLKSCVRGPKTNIVKQSVVHNMVGVWLRRSSIHLCRRPIAGSINSLRIVDRWNDWGWSEFDNSIFLDFACF